MISLRNLFGRLILTTRSNGGAEAEERATVSQLLRLPPEIILLVTSMLPTASAACLALCNRRLKHILGTGSWRSLQSEAPETQLAFLSCLARDLPQHFLCQECSRLHRLSAIRWPRLDSRYSDPRCTWLSSGYRPLFVSRYEIFFPHIHLAMRQHNCGTDIGIPLEVFQHRELQHHRTQQNITLLSVDAQIVSNELLMRSQTWTLIPWNRCDEFLDSVDRDSFAYDICVHTRLGALKKNLASDLVRSRLDQLETRATCRTPTLPCPYCWMDYLLDVVDFGDRGFAVLLTRWLNLGAGLHFADVKWQSHIKVQMARGLHHPHHPGDIRIGFEDQAELSVDEVTAENKLRLFSRRHTRRLW